MAPVLKSLSLSSGFRLLTQISQALPPTCLSGEIPKSGALGTLQGKRGASRERTALLTRRPLPNNSTDKILGWMTRPPLPQSQPPTGASDPSWAPRWTELRQCHQPPLHKQEVNRHPQVQIQVGRWWVVARTPHTHPVFGWAVLL